jgi:succinate dehydrogenase / fumarate reductase, iron-sulfur subunit
MRVAFQIHRYNPEREVRPRVADYRLDVGRGTTILDGLIRIKNEQDGTLTFRYSCRSAICGSCAMVINGTEKLACRTQIREELERHGEIRVAPLDNLTPIKDLVVDMAPFWGQINSITPWVEPLPQDTVDPMAMRDAYQAFNNAEGCIMCGACVAACTVYEVDRRFIGPAALAKAYRFVADPRESTTMERLENLQGAGGIWDCTRCNYCVEVCPKDVKPMEAIVRLRRASLEKGLTHTMGAGHILGFMEIIKSEGRLNEGLMPLKVVRKGGIRDLLRIIPLGFRMFLKGKVPFPFRFKSAIQGMEKIRALYKARGK